MSSPVRAEDEGFFRIWRRRVLTIPGFFLFGVLVFGLAPAALLFFLVMDLARPAAGSFARCRAYLFLLLFMGWELGCVLAAGLFWVFGFFVSAERFFGWHVWLQRKWMDGLLWGSARLYGAEIHVEGQEAIRPGPILLFLRHTSMADTVVAGSLAANPHDLVFRYLLKRELLWEPVMDVVGRRLRNVFLERGGDRERELAAIRRLAEGLGEKDGIVIYPEGTRFSQAKLERSREKLRELDMENLARRADDMVHVLPPRPGGTLALLEAAPQADVVVCAHTGFEGTATFDRFWDGGLVGTKIRVCFTRIPADTIPEGEEARKEWLFDVWESVDAWVEESLQNPPPVENPLLLDEEEENPPPVEKLLEDDENPPPEE